MRLWKNRYQTLERQGCSKPPKVTPPATWQANQIKRWRIQEWNQTIFSLNLITQINSTPMRIQALLEAHAEKITTKLSARRNTKLEMALRSSYISKLRPENEIMLNYYRSQLHQASAGKVIDELLHLLTNRIICKLSKINTVKTIRPKKTRPWERAGKRWVYLRQVLRPI